MLATAKHYAGDGLTAYDAPAEGDYPIDQGIDQVSRAEFEKLALSPYPTAIDKHHVGSVMPSFSSVDWTEDGLGNPVKMHASKELSPTSSRAAGLRRPGDLRLAGDPPDPR